MSTAPAPATSTIVVGVSARTGSPAALRWATALAARIDANVRAVLAWRAPRAPGAAGGHPPAVARTGPDDPERTAKDLLDSLVAATLGEDHGVECVVMRGGAVRVLVEAAERADLLVVDSPRPTRLATMSAKLVAPRLIYRTPCPVVVMPAAASDNGARAGLRRVANALVASAGTAGRAGLPPIPVTPGDQAG